MVTRALEKYLRISPKKLRPLATLVKRKPVEEALYALINSNKKGAAILKGVIESAISNAKRLPEKNLKEADLYISRVIVNAGPVLKRYRAMSMGRAGMIKKRTSHVLVELDATKKVSAETKKARVAKKPEKRFAKLAKRGKR